MQGDARAALRHPRQPTRARGRARRRPRPPRRRLRCSAATTPSSAAGRPRRVARLRELQDATWIRGNVDRWAAEGAPDLEPARSGVAACREHLDAEAVAALGALPESADLGARHPRLARLAGERPALLLAASPPGTRTSCSPGSPIAASSSATSTCPSSASAAGGIELVGPGSVGMPLDGDPRAAYALLHRRRAHRAPPRRLRPRRQRGARPRGRRQARRGARSWPRASSARGWRPPECAARAPERDGDLRGHAHGGADGVGAQPPDAAAQLPAHRDGERHVPARRDGRGARVGQRRRLLLRERVAHRAVDPGGRVRRVAGPARVGQQRAHDALLLRRRPRGAPGVRHRRAARAPAGDAAAARGARRDGRRRRGLPRRQRRAVVGAGLGRRDVDGHGLRARDARARGAALPRAAAHVHAHGRRRRRHRRARRDRDGLRDGSRRGAAADRDRALRPGAARQPPGRPLGRRVPRARGGGLGRALGVGRRPGRDRPGHGPRDLRDPGGALGPRARHRPLPPLPRAADAGARALRARGPRVCRLAQRAPPEHVSPLDQLRDRPALRARQRRDRDRRGVPRARRLIADHARDRPRLRRRQAARHPRHVVARDDAQPRRGCARPSAGPRSPAAAPSPASASRSRC